MVGRTISHYRILKKLDQGAMGEIYLAKDKILDREVVLKFLLASLTSDDKLKARFKREAKAAAALKHPNIITVHDMEEFEDRFYIVMEHVEGESLQKRIQRKEDTSISEVIDITIQICDGLGNAHRAEIVHRDIKPANIMVKNDGLVKVLDFGVALLKADTRLTTESEILGTIPYMSPEQIRGVKHIDERSDIFSVAVVLYELLTLHLPFQGNRREAIMFSILHEPPEPLARYNARITEGLQRIIEKALDKDVETRYQHIDDLCSDLKREKKLYLTDQSTIVVNGKPGLKPEPDKKAGSRLIGFWGLAVIATLSVLLVIFWPKPTSEPESQQTADDGGRNELTSKEPITDKIEADVEPTEKDKLYQKYRAEGDDLFAQGNFEEAKTKYQFALEQKPGDQYAADKLKQCDSKIAEAERQRLVTKPKKRGIQASTHRPDDKTIEEKIVSVETGIKLRHLRIEDLSHVKVQSMIKEYDFYAPEGYPLSNPSGKGIANNFSLQENGMVVLDRATGLLWQQSGSEYVTYAKVQEYINSLNREKFSGYNDWRLPTLEETMTLMESEQENNNLYIDSIFDSERNAIWTADKLDYTNAWVVDFTKGKLYIALIAKQKFVRAVR